jgi:hypothetical protein
VDQLYNFGELLNFSRFYGFLEVEDMQSQPLKPFDFTDEETDSSSVK